MENNPNDKLLRAYARLSSLKENLPQNLVPETFVTEYHEALKHVEDLGFDVDEFKVPAHLVEPTVTSFNYVSGEKHYSTTRYVDRDFLMTKLSAALSYFQLSIQSRETPSSTQTIGFKGSRKV
jgi:hypothetical protein